MKNIIVLLILGVYSISSFATGIEKIQPSLIEKYSVSSTNSVIIVLKEQADVSFSKRINTKLEKAKYVITTLQNTAHSSQSDIIAILKAANIHYKSFYITNAIQAKVDLNLLYALAEMEEVSIIIDDSNTPMQVLREERVVSDFRSGLPEWGISKIKADSVWLLGHRGEGVIVGGQDTGFDFDLNLLIDKYRGVGDNHQIDHNYNWHDAIHEINPFNVDSSLVGIDSILKEVIYDIDTLYMDTTILIIDTVMIDSIYTQIDSMRRGQINPCGLNSKVPCDDHGHGSHTMGTMVGGDTTDVIGVAPDAKWIACRNMERGWGRPSSYIECFEWFMNPTDINGANPDPSKAPHVINNSWACPPVEGCAIADFSIMDEVVNNIKASGVVVVVSAGNSGSGCETITTPAAIYEGSFSVGATDINDEIAGFSSRGAVIVDGSMRMKPNVTAPGVGVRSCIPGNRFGTWSGTSMAGPHVVGLVALLISANPQLAGHVDLIEYIIETTSDPKTSDQDCSGSSGMEIPNPIFGYGRVNAYKAVQKAKTIVIPRDYKLKLYPNPVRDYWNVFSVKNYYGKVNWELYSINGIIVQKGNWINKGIINQKIEAEKLPSGLYFYKLYIGDSVLSSKMVKL